jgi:hypothetical protein
MEDKDYMRTFDEYLLRHPDLNPEVAERFRPVYEQLDEEFFVFIMTQVVL